MAYEEPPQAFTKYELAMEWFIDNVVKEYCEWNAEANEELADMCGPDYLDPRSGAVETLLEKFERQIFRVDLNP